MKSHDIRCLLQSSTSLLTCQLSPRYSSGGGVVARGERRGEREEAGGRRTKPDTTEPFNRCASLGLSVASRVRPRRAAPQPAAARWVRESADELCSPGCPRPVLVSTGCPRSGRRGPNPQPTSPLPSPPPRDPASLTLSPHPLQPHEVPTPLSVNSGRSHGPGRYGDSAGGQRCVGRAGGGRGRQSAVGLCRGVEGTRGRAAPRMSACVGVLPCFTRLGPAVWPHSLPSPAPGLGLAMV